MAANDRFQEIVHAARAAAGPSGDIELMLRHMRSEGMSPTESIKGLMAIAEISLVQAKNFLHYSQTWADIREDQERLQQALAEEAEREY